MSPERDLRALPKVDLHVHLEGSMRPTTVVLGWDGTAATVRSTLTGDEERLEADTLVIAETPVRLSSTWMPITSEFGEPITVTVRLLSYFVVRVPSYSDSRCWNVV